MLLNQTVMLSANNKSFTTTLHVIIYINRFYYLHIWSTEVTINIWFAKFILIIKISRSVRTRQPPTDSKALHVTSGAFLLVTLLSTTFTSLLSGHHADLTTTKVSSGFSCVRWSWIWKTSIVTWTRSIRTIIIIIVTLVYKHLVQWSSFHMESFFFI